MKSILCKEVFIVGAARTPVGAFLGSLSNVTAPVLGTTAIKSALNRAKVDPNEVDNVIMGHVLSAGCGQNPTRQAALGANIPITTDVFGVNKVCASGLKAVSLGASSISIGESGIVVSGGMESMSKVPYINSKVRGKGFKFGHEQFEDILISDGLWDPYNNIHMGSCTEKVVKDYNITRQMQDEYAIESYRRASIAWKDGIFKKEVCPVKVDKTEVTEDEQYTKLKLEKVSSLKPTFEKNGTITAANASGLNDGASSVILANREQVEKLNLKPIAKILSYADAACEPINFGVAPYYSILKAKKLAGLNSCDFYEINEAFSAVVLANMMKLNLDHSRVNVFGGAVSLGHPIGSSGCRILVTLLNVLQQKNAEIGCASICNGGGGSTSMIIERLN